MIIFTVIEVSCGEYGQDLVDRMVNSVESKAPLVPINRPYSHFEVEREKYTVSWGDQFATLFKRMMLQMYRDRVSAATRITQTHTRTHDHRTAKRASLVQV